ncbi:YibE/F family protein [Sediminispirochaeta smaragdinae]|uniref:YibE/F family protein n=1 Tax=Sediminispirochaeta smaragdinae (strain DSM 11293 / JCM 15392 / SEBR 4228) TaxID=573413 RepID=E1R9Q6_SEDSS|nr:YibE/F family protein [Sediminispirochaeta smaragdinae]ADK83225.1 YibE/F family protein [Sediminispirochaeta smaragdinae DSM 11293]
MIDTKEKKEQFFVFLIFAGFVALLFVPTGFQRPGRELQRRVRAVVLTTDESDVAHNGIIRTGTQHLHVRIASGPFKGKEEECDNLLMGKLELDRFYTPGNTILAVLQLNEAKDEILTVQPVDHYRIRVEALLVLAFFAFLLLYARWTGLKAIVSFLFTAAVIWKILIPGFLKGLPPIPLTMIVTAIITAAIIFLVGGRGKRSLIAFLGAMVGVIATAILAVGFGKAFRVHGAIKPFSEMLLYAGFPHLDLTNILFAGIFLASSGAVMDIAMDIAASMEEIVLHNPTVERKKLIHSGFAVGRAVIGTMTTTLLLAYSGGYTALLMVFMAQGTPGINIVNLGYVAAEILHTLVGSFGLVLVAPFTAIIGGVMLRPSKEKGDQFTPS